MSRWRGAHRVIGPQQSRVLLAGQVPKQLLLRRGQQPLDPQRLHRPHGWQHVPAAAHTLKELDGQTTWAGYPKQHHMRAPHTGRQKQLAHLPAGDSCQQNITVMDSVGPRTQSHNICSQHKMQHRRQKSNDANVFLPVTEGAARWCWPSTYQGGSTRPSYSSRSEITWQQ